MITPGSELLARAETIAEDLLFPSAIDTDTAHEVPRSNFDALADAGLYGIFAPPELGGLGADFDTMRRVVEILAGGCLATTLVWVQHFGLLGTMLGDAPQHLKAEWLSPLISGERRSGIALVGLRPGPPRLVAESDGSDWVLTGEAPWVTGWGQIDGVQLVARNAEDPESVVWLLLETAERPGLTVTRQSVVAADAADTVLLDFAKVRIPGDQLLRAGPRESTGYPVTDALKVNGSLALGVAARCCRLIGPSPLDQALVEARSALDSADDLLSVSAARAHVGAFAVQAAAALVTHTGSGAVTQGSHAQRLAREATFSLVFGTRPQIATALLERFGVR